MNFVDFIARHANDPGDIGHAASACLHSMYVEKAGPIDCERELRDEAQCEGTYRGLKELWAAWLDERGQPNAAEGELPARGLPPRSC